MSLKPRVVPIKPTIVPTHPFDSRYGTDTGGLIPGRELASGHQASEWITAYYAVAPSILVQLIDLWQQTSPVCAIEQYTLLDVGAGKGRALLTAAQQPFLQVVGVELDSRLAAIARSNIDRFSSSPFADVLSPIELIEGDVLEVPLPATPTAVLMFHPFEAPMLRRFLARLVQHYSGHGTHLDILYVNAEHADVIDRNGSFRTVFRGMVPMSAEDHRADLAEIENQAEYGSTGDELCTIHRFGPHRQSTT